MPVCCIILAACQTGTSNRDSFVFIEEPSGPQLYGRAYKRPKSPVSRPRFLAGVSISSPKFMNDVAKYYKFNNTKAFKGMMVEAEAGSTPSQYYVGYAYENGLGIGIDYKKAFYWYYQSAFKGNTPAQAKLGNMYENGIGTSVNLRAALKWYKHAADYGDAQAKLSYIRLLLELDGKFLKI